MSNRENRNAVLAVKLHKCFVDRETSLHVPSAWGVSRLKRSFLGELFLSALSKKKSQERSLNQ